jgi:Possible tRNA binding domain
VFLQAALLAGVGLQRLGLSELSGHLGLPYPQLLALFNKVRRRAAAVRWSADSIHDQCSPGDGSAVHQRLWPPDTSTSVAGFNVD